MRAWVLAVAALCSACRTAPEPAPPCPAPRSALPGLPSDFDALSPTHRRALLAARFPAKWGTDALDYLSNYRCPSSDTLDLMIGSDAPLVVPLTEPNARGSRFGQGTHRMRLTLEQLLLLLEMPNVVQVIRAVTDDTLEGP